MTGPVQDAISSRIDYELETPEVPTSNENTGVLEISDSSNTIPESKKENLKNYDDDKIVQIEHFD